MNIEMPETMTPDTTAPDAPAPTVTPPLVRPIIVRRPNRPRFSEMSLQDLCDWNHQRRETQSGAAALPAGPSAPKPRATQAEIEKWVNGFVASGGMSAENAESLLARMALNQPRRSAGPAALSEADQARQRLAALNLALLKAGIPEALWGLRINANPFLTENGHEFVWAADDGLNRRAFVECRKLAARWKPGEKGLTLRSPSVGVGKTLFAYATLVYITAHHVGRDGKGRARCQAVSAKGLLDLLRSSFGATWEKNPGVQSTEAVRQKYLVVPDVLLIDDLGKENVRGGEAGEWARAELLDLLDYRMEKRLTTILTTNLTDADTLHRYGAAFVSRMLGRSPVVEMSGPDYRLLQGEGGEADPFAYDGEFQGGAA